MRFSTTILAGLLAAVSVSAQDAAANSTAVITSTDIVIVSSTTSLPVSGTYVASPAEQSRDVCLADCDPADNDCRAACLPLADAQNPTATCQAKCYKGIGNAQDNNAYEGCYKECIRTAAVATQNPTSAPVTTKTQSKGEATETVETTAATGAEKTGADQTSGTATESAAPDATGAAATLKIAGSAAVLFGAAAFVLVL